MKKRCESAQGIFMYEMVDTQSSTMEAVLRPPNTSTGLLPASVIQCRWVPTVDFSQSEPVHPHLYETQCLPVTKEHRHRRDADKNCDATEQNRAVVRWPRCLVVAWPDPVHVSHAVRLYQVTATVLEDSLYRPRGFDDCNMILMLPRRAWKTRWVLKVGGKQCQRPG